jgi:hypothetical protein
VRTFNAGDYAAAGGGSITVDSGDQTSFTYWIIGNVMTISINVYGIDVTGTVTYIEILIPASKTATNETRTTGIMFNNSGSVTEVCEVLVSGTTLVFRRIGGVNMTATAGDNTGFMGVISFRIN